MVRTQNNVSEELPPFPTLPTLVEKQQQEATGVNKGAFALRPRKRERSHLAIAMEIMDEIEAEIDDEIISNGLDAEDTMAPDLFQQSLTKL